MKTKTTIAMVGVWGGAVAACVLLASTFRPVPVPASAPVAAATTAPKAPVAQKPTVVTLDEVHVVGEIHRARKPAAAPAKADLPPPGAGFWNSEARRKIGG